MARTWFVTGATRGIGAEIVKGALAAGDRVVATGRDTAKIADRFDAGPDRLLAIALDVTDAAQTAAAVEAAVAGFGGIDILVNNAGYGQLGLFEESDPADIAQQFATNVFGLFGVTRAALPVMRRQRSGRIFNLSSIAGLRGGPGASIYCASKHAVEGFSEALAQEVAPFGVHVTLIEPGVFRTDFLDPSSARFNGNAIPDYAEAAAGLRSAYRARNHQQPGDPAKLAQAILTLASTDSPPIRFVAGPDAVDLLETKIGKLKSDLDAWRALSIGTDGSW